MLVLWFIFSILFSACSQSEATLPAAAEVDPLFRDFYSLRSGEVLLGRALGPAYSEGGQTFQVVENAVLAYNPAQPPGEQFGFATIGSLLVAADPPLPVTEQNGVQVLNQHILYQDFAGTFQNLGELRFVGYPLTEVRVNHEQNRIEQYFERLGLYHNQGDPAEATRLLPYGRMYCHQRQNGTGCSFSHQDAIPQTLPPEPFLALLDRLGNDFIGKPLSPVYLAEDGNLEQVYENIVVAAPPDNLRALFFRPLPQMTSFSPQPPVNQISESGLTFIPLDGQLGHNVATAFIEYAAHHGGNGISGPPTSELFEFNGLRRQCFTNYCLDFDPRAPAAAQIRPAPLGLQYWGARNTLTPSLQLRVWEQTPYLAPNATQIVGLLVYNQTPSQPLNNLQPTLIVTLPDGSQQRATFPPTSLSGSSYLEWKQTSLTGTYQYEICVNWPEADPVCARESWLVR